MKVGTGPVGEGLDEDGMFCARNVLSVGSSVDEGEREIFAVGVCGSGDLAAFASGGNERGFGWERVV